MTKHPLQAFIDAPLASATKVNLPAGRCPATRAPKVEYADEIGMPKLSGKEMRERKAKGRSAKLEALFDYYAATELSAVRIAEHMGLYRQQQTGVDKDTGKPIMSRVLDTELAETQLAWRRAASGTSGSAQDRNGLDPKGAGPTGVAGDAQEQGHD